MNLIKAKATTNSADDIYGRVSVESGIWQSKCLVAVINNLAINKDDLVYVDVSNNFENPIIVGLVTDNTKTSPDNHTRVFHSKSSKGESSCYVSGDSITFNEGENGGLCITPELKKQLETMSARIDTIMLYLLYSQLWTPTSRNRHHCRPTFPL